MKKIILKDAKSLAEVMHDTAGNDNEVVAAVFFDNAVGVMRELMKYDDVEVEYIDISSAEYASYESEYLVTLSGDYELCIEPACDSDDGRYLYFDADVFYVDGEASSAILNMQTNPECTTFELGWGKDGKHEEHIEKKHEEHTEDDGVGEKYHKIYNDIISLLEEVVDILQC